MEEDEVSIFCIALVEVGLWHWAPWSLKMCFDSLLSMIYLIPSYLSKAHHSINMQLEERLSTLFMVYRLESVIQV